MDNFVYKSFDTYFRTLEKTGYEKSKNMESLLLLNFFYSLMFHDYRGFVSQEDYILIEKALNCLYGKNCLIPYPDYLKMNKLRIGEMTEVLARTKALEEHDKVQDAQLANHEERITENTRRIDDHERRFVNIEKTVVNKPYKEVAEISDIVIPE